MRKASICVLILLFFMWVVYPVYAYSGAVKVVEEAALALAKKEAVREAIAIAAAAGGGVATGSMAVRIATAGVPWLGLGLTIGLIAYDIYYSSSDLNTLYNNANVTEAYHAGGSISSYPVDNRNSTQAGTISTEHVSSMDGYNASDYGYTYWGLRTEGCVPKAGISTLYQMRDYMGWPGGVGMVFDNGYTTTSAGSCDANNWRVRLYYGYNAGTSSYAPVYVPGGVTVGSVQDWFDANPSSGLNPDNRVNPVGLGSSPQNATDVSYIPLSVGDVTVTTKAAPDVGDIVIGDGFPPVDPMVTESTQTTTRETTTVDGVDTIEETATTTCGAGSHDDRTFGSVLQSHVLTWQNNGVVASIGLLHSIAFPDTLPVINFDSMFGHLEVDMSDFSSWFTAVKVLLIASTVILSYRIVFGGG